MVGSVTSASAFGLESLTGLATQIGSSSYGARPLVHTIEKAEELTVVEHKPKASLTPPSAPIWEDFPAVTFPSTAAPIPNQRSLFLDFQGAKDSLEKEWEEKNRRNAKPVEEINHPSHYGGADNPYEAIKVIEAWEVGFNVGQVLKYISRMGKKPGESALKDAKKALWYLNREIQNMEKVSVRS